MHDCLSWPACKNGQPHFLSKRSDTHAGELMPGLACQMVGPASHNTIMNIECNKMMSWTVVVNPFLVILLPHNYMQVYTYMYVPAISRVGVYMSAYN